MGPGAAPGDQNLNSMEATPLNPMEATPMARRCGGSGLLFAGVIVTLVGLAVATMHTLAIPGYWTTLAVGLALLAAGVIRALARGRRGADTRAC